MAPIIYNNNLAALYDLYEEENDATLIREFEELLISICNVVEGIYICAHYIFVLLYDIRKGRCNVPIDIDKLIGVLSEAVNNNWDNLKNTTWLRRFPIEDNVLENIIWLNETCYEDNGIYLFQKK